MTLRLKQNVNYFRNILDVFIKTTNVFPLLTIVFFCLFKCNIFIALFNLKLKLKVIYVIHFCSFYTACSLLSKSECNSDEFVNHCEWCSNGECVERGNCRIYLFVCLFVYLLVMYLILLFVHSSICYLLFR